MHASPLQSCIDFSISFTWNSLLTYHPLRIILLLSLLPILLIRYLVRRLLPLSYSLSPTNKKRPPSLPLLNNSLPPTYPTPPSERKRSSFASSYATRPDFRQRSPSVSSIASTVSATSQYSTSFNAAPLPSVSPFSILRTPEERFENLPDWNYATKYFYLENKVRVAYIDEGNNTSSSGSAHLLNSKRQQPTVMCIHGGTTWGYMFRRLIPHLTNAGYRVLCLDLPGFGKSDKLASIRDHSILLHVNAVTTFLLRIVGSGYDTPITNDYTLIGHGFGSALICLALKESFELQNTIRRIVVLNPYLSPQYVEELQLGTLERLYITAACANVIGKALPVSSVIRASIAERKRKGEIASARKEHEFYAYDAPFPSKTYVAGPAAVQGLLPLPLLSDPLVIRLRQIFPSLTRAPLLGSLLSAGDGIRTDLELAKEWIVEWGSSRTGLAGSVFGGSGARVLVVYGKKDTAFADAGRWFETTCGNLSVVGLEDAGHYVLEDVPKECAEIVTNFIKVGA